MSRCLDLDNSHSRLLFQIFELGTSQKWVQAYFKFSAVELGLLIWYPTGVYVVGENKLTLVFCMYEDTSFKLHTNYCHSLYVCFAQDLEQTFIYQWLAAYQICVLKGNFAYSQFVTRMQFFKADLPFLEHFQPP